MRAVGSNLAHPQRGHISKLGRVIVTDLRTVRLAIAPWEKGASREIDCRAIGGLGGCKRFAQGWVGENADLSDRTLHPSQVA